MDLHRDDKYEGAEGRRKEKEEAEGEKGPFDSPSALVPRVGPVPFSSDEVTTLQMHEQRLTHTGPH